MTDKNNTTIQIGDIVKIENSPIKSDNATYVVGQDGTSKNYIGKDLTLYKVAKHKDGYSLSRASYNLAFYPLHNYSSKYHFTREEMNAATIEVLVKADVSKYNLVKSDDMYENEATDQTYFRAVLKYGDKEIEDVSYSADEPEKVIAFFSNIILKQDEVIEIVKQDHSWAYYYKNIAYKLESAKPVEEVKEEVVIVEQITTEQTKTEIAEIDNLHFDISEVIDTRDNSTIYLVKVQEKLSKDEYIKVNNFIKSIGGYYSRYKHAFLFKENPIDLLKSEVNQEDVKTSEQQIQTEYQTEAQAEQPPQQQQEIKKAIDFEIEESQHTETKKPIWLVKIKNSLSKDEFAEVKRNFATLKGFYSSFNNSFIFKYDPTEKLKITA